MTIYRYSYNWGIKPYTAMGHLTRYHFAINNFDKVLLGFAALYQTYFYRYMVVLGCAVLFHPAL